MLCPGSNDPPGRIYEHPQTGATVMLPAFPASEKVYEHHLAAARMEMPDVGVAVYFDRAVKPDFSWQEALEIHEPAPSESRIQDAFKRKAMIYHPDRGGDALASACDRRGARTDCRPGCCRRRADARPFPRSRPGLAIGSRAGRRPAR